MEDQYNGRGATYVNSYGATYVDFDHNYYNNNLKYAANRTLFLSITPVTGSTKSEVFPNDFFSKFKEIQVKSAGNNWCIHISWINS